MYRTGTLARALLNFSFCAAALSLLATACSTEDPTALVVVTDTNIRRPSVMDQVVVRFQSGSDSKVASQFVTSTDDFPKYVTLVAGNDDEVTVVVEGRKGGNPIVQSTAVVQLVNNQISVVELPLLQSCLSVDCDGFCNLSGCQEVSSAVLTEWTGEVPTIGAPQSCTTDSDCDDGLPCNGEEECIELSCASGTAPSCDDNIVCTTDSCDDSAGGCVHEPDNSVCTAAPDGFCDAANDCQYGTCSAATCQDRPELCQTAECEGALCKLTSTCAAGQDCCAGACVPAGCDDGNACTVRGCLEDQGCVTVSFKGMEQACDDGVACTGAGQCNGAGACINASDLCNLGNPCIDYGACDTQTGQCPLPQNRVGVSCDDGNACTLNTVCSNGVCGGGTTNPCDDGNPCTQNLCNVDTGCSNPVDSGMNGFACDDGNPCTVGTRCSGGSCDCNGGCGQDDFPVDCVFSGCTVCQASQSSYQCFNCNDEIR